MSHVMYRDNVENWARGQAIAQLVEPITDKRLARDLASCEELERVLFGTYEVVVLETPTPSWTFYRMLVYPPRRRAAAPTALRTIQLAPLATSSALPVDAALPVAAIDLMRWSGPSIAVPGFCVRVGRRERYDPPYTFGFDVTYALFRTRARRILEDTLLPR